MTSGSDARYAQGWLLFIRDGTVVAQAFDAGPATLAGDPISIGAAMPVMLGLEPDGPRMVRVAYLRPIRSEAGPMYKCILLPTDGTELCERA